jgi:hypothetical protein
MKNVIGWLKRYCVRKGLSHLEITIKRKDRIGEDGFEVSIQKKTIAGVIKEDKPKMRVKVVKAGK